MLHIYFIFLFSIIFFSVLNFCFSSFLLFLRGMRDEGRIWTFLLHSFFLFFSFSFHICMMSKIYYYFLWSELMKKENGNVCKLFFSLFVFPPSEISHFDWGLMGNYSKNSFASLILLKKGMRLGFIKISKELSYRFTQNLTVNKFQVNYFGFLYMGVIRAGFEPNPSDIRENLLWK